MNKSQEKTLIRLVAGAIFLLLAIFAPTEKLFDGDLAFYAKLALYLIPYFVIGGDVLLRAAKNILGGHIFDENFLMAVATLGVFFLTIVFREGDDYTEAVAVMLFYQVGELFQNIAVDRSRRSIAELMNIRPDYANVERDGAVQRLEPEAVEVGEIIVIRPGERVPLDGVIVEGVTALDLSALTGESAPRAFDAGDEILSGAVNLTGLLRVRVSKIYGESTVARILELVENAGDKKARAENFITRFARYYTPVVCAFALLLAVFPPLALGQNWADWVRRGLVFLVVSCPCALVISIPMSFFGGIGGASRRGILVKGGNYLEVLARADTVVFDKTGTLTTGSFAVTGVYPKEITRERLLSIAASAEAHSSHPIALSIIVAAGEKTRPDAVFGLEEIPGRGVTLSLKGTAVAVGNALLMRDLNVSFTEPRGESGTAVYVARNGEYLGCIVISDSVKPDAREALDRLKRIGIRKSVILTGDKRSVAWSVAQSLGVDEFYAELLPQNKVETLEKLLLGQRPGAALAFVGDGINDAPVLSRADVGIAMGALGADAAIEAADVVLMDDKVSSLVTAVRIARKTMGIVRQNIVFALGVKFAVLVLAALGFAGMWLAVFADVGVAFLAVLNAMRCLSYKKNFL